MTNPRKDDDVDDFMSSIIKDDDINDFMSVVINDKHKLKPKKNRLKNHLKKVDVSKVKKSANIVRRRIPRKRLLYITLIPMVLMAVFFGFSKLTPDLFVNSPFEEDIREAVDYGLYYPTSLPAGYKVETNSIQKVEGSVVIYAISNDDGKRITVSSQEKPEGIDIDKIYGDLNDIYDLKTHNGDVKVGRSPSGVLVATMTLGGTWLILNTPNGNVSVEEFNQVLVSRFKKG